jgi:hypothetical protein
MKKEKTVMATKNKKTDRFIGSDRDNPKLYKGGEFSPTQAVMKKRWKQSTRINQSHTSANFRHIQAASIFIREHLSSK